MVSENDTDNCPDVVNNDQSDTDFDGKAMRVTRMTIMMALKTRTIDSQSILKNPPILIRTG